MNFKNHLTNGTLLNKVEIKLCTFKLFKRFYFNPQTFHLIVFPKLEV